MAKSNRLGEGLEDRRERSTIRARLRRRDGKHVRHDISMSFRYDPGDRASRRRAIEDARAWLSEQQRDWRAKKTTAHQLHGETVGAWIERYIAEALAGRGPHAAKKGIRREISVLQQLQHEFPALMARAPDEVTQVHLAGVRDDLLGGRQNRGGKNLKPVTIKRWFSCLAAVYVTARQSWGFPNVPNPVHQLPMPRARAIEQAEREGRLVDAEELERILQAIPQASPATRACIRFLRWTGARRSEAVKLDWSDVDLDAMTATFRNTKSPRGRSRKRTIPLDDNALAALKEAMGGKPQPASGRVFPLGVDTPTRAWIRGRSRAGLHDVRLHDLRHTRTTELAGVLTILEAQSITGHSDIRMLARYFHSDVQAMGRKLRGEIASLEDEYGKDTLQKLLQLLNQLGTAKGGGRKQ